LFNRLCTTFVDTDQTCSGAICYLYELKQIKGGNKKHDKQ